MQEAQSNLERVTDSVQRSPPCHPEKSTPAKLSLNVRDGSPQRNLEKVTDSMHSSIFVTKKIAPSQINSEGEGSSVVCLLCRVT